MSLILITVIILFNEFCTFWSIDVSIRSIMLIEDCRENNIEISSLMMAAKKSDSSLLLDNLDSFGDLLSADRIFGWFNCEKIWSKQLDPIGKKS